MKAAIQSVMVVNQVLNKKTQRHSSKCNQFFKEFDREGHKEGKYYREDLKDYMGKKSGEKTSTFGYGSSKN